VSCWVWDGAIVLNVTRGPLGVGVSETVTVVVDLGRPDANNHTLQLDCRDEVRYPLRMERLGSTHWVRLESRHLESKGAARFILEGSAGWASPSSLP
jgi:hypothetical protein